MKKNEWLEFELSPSQTSRREIIARDWTSKDGLRHRVYISMRITTAAGRAQTPFALGYIDVATGEAVPDKLLTHKPDFYRAMEVIA